jgi:hypothetical protein
MRTSSHAFAQDSCLSRRAGLGVAPNVEAIMNAGTVTGLGTGYWKAERSVVTPNLGASSP